MHSFHYHDATEFRALRESTTWVKNSGPFSFLWVLLQPRKERPDKVPDLIYL